MFVDSKNLIGSELKTRSTLWVAALFVLLCGEITWAQVTTGTISGVLRDSTGGVLPGGKVMLLNKETGISRTVETDETGRYTAPSLSVGMYSVTASLSGFQPEVRRGIVLTVGLEAIVNFTLSVGSTAQALEV